MKKTCNDEPKQWDKFLQPLLFAYHEVPQCTTVFSPFEWISGHNVGSPLFLLKEKFLDQGNDPEQIHIIKYVIDMRNRIRDFMKLSNENESIGKRKQKVYYDRHNRKRSYVLGDKVLFLLPTSTSK